LEIAACIRNMHLRHDMQTGICIVIHWAQPNTSNV
jgi:hypothetical protein